MTDSPFSEWKKLEHTCRHSSLQRPLFLPPDDLDPSKSNEDLTNHRPSPPPQMDEGVLGYTTHTDSLFALTEEEPLETFIARYFSDLSDPLNAPLPSSDPVARGLLNAMGSIGFPPNDVLSSPTRDLPSSIVASPIFPVVGKRLRELLQTIEGPSPDEEAVMTQAQMKFIHQIVQDFIGNLPKEDYTKEEKAIDVVLGELALHLDKITTEWRSLLFSVDKVKEATMKSLETDSLEAIKADAQMEHQERSETTHPPSSAESCSRRHTGGRLILKKWFLDHILHPYPTEEEKVSLCHQTGLDLTQLNNFFINARRRSWKTSLMETL